MSDISKFLSSYNEILRQELAVADIPFVLTEHFEFESCVKQQEGRKVYFVKQKANGVRAVLLITDGENRDRAIYEGNILAKLDNPAIPKTFGVWQYKGRGYLIREYFTGDDLHTYIVKHGVLNPDMLIDITIRLCDILTYIHNQTPAVIHRDIKPENIIIAGKNNVKLIDFGIARDFRNEAENDTTIAGTKFYMAPEQFGSEQTDNRADIYSLGVVMVYLATGNTDTRNLKTTYPYKELVPIIKKCIKKDRDQRFKTAARLKQKILWMRRKIRQKILICAAVCALIAITFIFGLYLGQEQGFESGAASTYDAAYELGYDVGYDAGYDIGHDAGYDIGHDAGYVAGNEFGYESGITSISETPSETDNQPAQEEEVDEARALVRGYWNGKIYTNEFAGFEYTSPEGWVQGTDEEMAALMGIATRELGERGVEVTESMLTLTTIYDMSVTNPVTGSSLIIMYENLSMHIGGTQITTEQYIDSILRQIKGLGMDFEFFDDVRNVIIGKETYYVLDLHLSAHLIIQSYYIRRIDNFMLVIIETLVQGEQSTIPNFVKIT